MKKHPEILALILCILVLVAIMAICFFLDAKIFEWVMSSNLPDWFKFVILHNLHK